MKRAARFFTVLPFLLFLFHLPPSPPAAHAQGADPAAAEVCVLLNDLRLQRGFSELAGDPLLELTAREYAADLRRRAELSHVDEAGRRVLQRFQARGGTTVLVGEILGSGPDPASVAAAWEASSGHREVLLNPLWTHCGAGSASAGQTTVWVVLFASHRVYPLEILRCSEGYQIRGRLASAQALEPVLISGIESVDPLQWDRASGAFSFFIPEDRGKIYHRLGYRRTGGGLIVTNTFYPFRAVQNQDAKSGAVTSDRERGCR
jgi:hypothetical protein